MTSPPCSAEGLPLWELGIGMGVIYLPDYRGADQSSTFVLPFPYFAYHGKLLKVDESGIYGRLFGTDRVVMDLSLGGGIPVSSRDNGARAGMPDLDPTVELGPSVDIRLSRDAIADQTLWLRLPVRAVFSVSLADTAQQGWLFSPYLEYRLTHIGRLRRWRVGISAGPIFADRDYHAYFYSVAPAFATARRPAYSAGGGYSGSRITVTAQRRFGRFWVGAFARYDNLSGAVIADSPLVKTTSYFATGLGVTWVLAESATLVTRP
jgi:outer membrane protein